ncbi:MAG TPA: hypothetical protein VHC69_05505 [Polyangiaceae bacterium]|nr:hypothetical protein [Polyangiaceae bacterium]
MATVACTSHHDKPCPPNEPAFRVQITATDGPLPPDTALTVKYYGTPVMESYSLAKGGPGNLDICCRPGTPTSGALPDVKCGIPPQVDASVIALRHDAATIRDAATSPSGAPIRDAATGLDASTTADAASDAASPTVRDASAEEPRDHDAGRPRAASGPGAIFCDLWTNGYAEVQIDATGYAKLHVVLNDAFVPDPRCGVQTVNHHLTLTHGDGGLLQ